MSESKARPRVDLSGEVAEAPAGRLEERPQPLRAEPHEVQVQRPEDLLDVRAGVGGLVVGDPRASSARGRRAWRPARAADWWSRPGTACGPDRPGPRGGAAPRSTRSRSLGRGRLDHLPRARSRRPAATSPTRPQGPGLVAAKRSRRVGAAPSVRVDGGMVEGHRVLSVQRRPARTQATAASTGVGPGAQTVQVDLPEHGGAEHRGLVLVGSSRSRRSSAGGPRACRRSARPPPEMPTERLQVDEPRRPARGARPGSAGCRARGRAGDPRGWSAGSCRRTPPVSGSSE